MSGAADRGRLQPRPYGRRSAIVLLIGAAGLLVWALTAGDDPALRTAAVGGVAALTIAGTAIRYAHRAIREQRGAAPEGPAPAAGAPELPDSYSQLLHQLDAAVRSPSYLSAVLVPRLEELLEEKQPGSARDRVRGRLRRLAAAAAAPRWSRGWLVAQLLRNRRATAAAVAAAARDLARLP